MVVFFKLKTAYEMRISDWSSDVCSSDLIPRLLVEARRSGVVNIQDGTKGGRRAPRWVQVTPLGLLALRCAALAAGGRPNLLAAGDRLISEIGRAHACTPVTHSHLVCRLHLDKKNKHQYNHIRQSTY